MKITLPTYLPLFIIFILFLIFLATETLAHDWYSGIRNPNTGVGCCGGNDCGPVDVNRILETDREYIIDGKWVFKKPEDVMPSQDGGYHACIWGGKPRCFFAPSNV